MRDELVEAFAAWRAFSPGRDEGVRVFFAPGRVNLIGEHLDYNGGQVMPAALDLGTWAIVRMRDDGVLRIASTAFGERVTCQIDKLHYDAADDYANYPKGAIWALMTHGVKAKGMDLLFHGNLPNRAGLSSSASVELATLVAQNHLCQANLGLADLARLGQRTENEFVGVNSGIMDQFAVAMGRENNAILLDCDTLQYELVSMDIGNYQLVITNTNKSRGLMDSKYNERRAECEAALADLRKMHPSLRHLAHVQVEEWEDWQSEVTNPVAKRRARHVVTENHRVTLAAQALRAGQIGLFGELMRQSHESLRDDFEVTGRELDALAMAAWSAPGCVGSRMTGAGFGGCTVSLVENESIPAFQEEVSRWYHDEIGIAPSFYVTGIGNGAREVTQEVLD